MAQAYRCLMPERWGMTLRLGHQGMPIEADGRCEPPPGFERYFDAQPAHWEPVRAPDALGNAPPIDPVADPQNADVHSGSAHRKKRGRRPQ